MQEEGTMTTSQTREAREARDDAENTARNVANDVASTTRDVANDVADKASAVAAKLPEAAATTRSAVEEATRRMEAGSDEALAVGASLSIGLAIGLLLGGANRLLVVLALIPATAMSFTLLDRHSGGRLSSSASTTRRGG
jgi:chemotaxis response regulator CheB